MLNMLGLRCRALASPVRCLMFGSQMTTRLQASIPTSSTTSSIRTFSSALPSILSQGTLSRYRTAVPSALGALQTRSFSASACLAGKRSTYNPSRRVQKRRHGFLARLRSRGGRNILMRRKAKGRKFLSW
ncbi:hypothetical protein ASPZODRAFT_134756 [Penicilliopsis zonata CBS 506.65]|uniref:Large ribosomal subunit protein bL34m n=1 Tax=Penicilliopsis zonata CBS 506.65 TaxID=1073090 RepID=A0A1L9SBW7_9EURO|nr:hypothetical protein ASPZODRAFT_134756 [Penicilliopsis zonata CBS 506.65]OJJ44671.1 hypothetical protein ASPZODRAFT_134756 [Penicilliopsis zonata CBS 506.65]